jgi:CHAT domain-containing protein/Tfp pilus assembly protein PilF
MIHGKPRRVALLASLFCFSIVYSPAGSSSALSQRPQDILTPQSAFEREIGGDEKHVYLLTLTAGQFARIVVEQPAVDVVLALVSPDGRPSAEVNNYPSPEPEYLSLISDTDGAYQLIISAADPRAARAKYAIRVEDWRAATPRDMQFVEAERKFSEATQLLRRGEADLLTQAAAIYQDALRRWRELGDRRYEMKTLVYLAAINERQENFRRFIELYSQALPIARDLGHRRFEGISLHGLGYGWHKLGEYRKALEYYRQALTIRQSLGAGGEMAHTLAAIGTAHTDLGEANLALDAFRKSLPLARASGNKAQLAFALNSMAWLHIRLAEYQLAINLLQEALPLWRETGNSLGEAAALNLTGMAYSYLFDMQNALSFYNQSIDFAEKSGVRFAAAQAFNNLGFLYWRLQDYDRALASYERSLRYWREIGNRPQELRTLNNLGLLYIQKGDTDKSLELYKAALGDRVDGKYLRTDAPFLSNIGFSHLRRGQVEQAPEEFQRALEWFQLALPLIRESRDRRMELLALTGEAEAHLMLNQSELALKEIEQAIPIGEKIRADITSPTHRVLSQPLMTVVYKQQVHALMRLHQENPSAGYDTLALGASEQYRLRTLLELLSESRIELSEGIDGGYLTRLRELQLKLESAEDRRSLSLYRREADKLAQIEKDIEELLRQRDLLDAEIRANHPQYAALKMPAPLSPSEIQRQLLDDGTIMLEYMLSRGRSYIWLITADSISSYCLPQVQIIDRAARRVQELITSSNQPDEGATLKEMQARQARRKAEFDLAAQELSRMILGPVAGRLGKKRLLIVGDGILQYIPFGVLPAPESGRAGERETKRIRNPQSAIRNPQSYTPLIADHEIVTLPSASVLATLRRIRTGRSTAPHALAILADPVFSNDDGRVALNARTQVESIQGPDQSVRAAPLAPTTKIVADVERSAAESGVQRFRRLLFSRQEAEAITGLLPASERLEALDFSADRRLALSGKLGEYRILHFATHGLLNNKIPALSGLVFSLVDEKGRPLNGFLRLHEIYNLKLNADLVVLSGCQTALGQEVSGEGLIGLTRGFMHAGAPRVVASLWNVNDQATANLMKLFYQRMLKDGLRPAAALRAAQIAMWKTEPNAVPYRWGAFILQGDWN